MRAGQRAAGLAFALLAGAWLHAAQLQAAQAWADRARAYKAYLALRRQGKYREALPYAQRVVEAVRNFEGENHVNYATALDGLAFLYYKTADYRRALPLYTQALALRRKLLGEEHPAVAWSLSSLALVHKSMGQYARALPLYSQAREILRKAHGEENREMATVLHNLATLYWSMGEYTKALPLCARSLAVRRKLLGERHRDVAVSLGLLALLHQALGEYAKAFPLYNQALEIFRKAHGQEHPSVATTLHNLASLYKDMGEYARALPLYAEALTMRRKFFGEEHAEVALSLNNLGGLYQLMGEHAKARPLHTRALAIRRKLFGEEHPAVAESLSNLAFCYVDMEEYAKALPLLVQALAMRRRLLPREHTEVARSLNNLAGLYQDMGEYAKALPLCTEAFGIWKKTCGEEHPLVATSLNNLAALAADLGRPEEAWTHAQRARRILLSTRARASATALTRSAFLAQHPGGDRLVCLALKLGKRVDFLQLAEQERALGLRELLAEARAQASAGLPDSERQRVGAALRRINALNSQLEKRATNHLPTESLRRELRQAEMDYDALMAELGGRYEHLVATETARAITSAQAAESSAIDHQMAIVGWVGYRDWLWGYVLRRNGVKWCDLSKGSKRLDELKLFRRILSASRRRSSPALLPDDLHSLYQRRFQPLEAHLNGARRLVVIAQGWAAHLPAEMLLTREPEKGEEDPSKWPWLCKRYEISYAPSVTTLDILCRQRAARKGKQWQRPLLALGDPPFSSEQLAQMEAEGKPTPLVAKAAGEMPLLALNRLVRFDSKAAPPRLPATRREVELLARLLGRDKSLLLVGPHATERKLFEANARGDLEKCRYIHLATHGLADSERPELSALVLARAGEDPDYDGLLQMREVFHLKLDAELVVLSACQSGLGKHLRGEGVVGLSTAFFFAGTPSLVTSVWNVPDVSTALLMRRFYVNLKAGQRKAAALREAKAWLRGLTRSDLEKLGHKDPLLSDLSRALGAPTPSPKGRLADEKPFAHPHYWAGFVLTGDPE